MESDKQKPPLQKSYESTKKINKNNRNEDPKLREKGYLKPGNGISSNGSISTPHMRSSINIIKWSSDDKRVCCSSGIMGIEIARSGTEYGSF